MHRLLFLVLLLVAGMLLTAAPAGATIHPIVESYDCANEEAHANHPLGDVADPIGQTPGVGNHADQSSLRALIAITKGFTDLSSPALFGHKLDGQCGKVGHG